MNEKTEIDELAPWLVVVLTLIGGGLRVFLLGLRGLWQEETISVWAASQGVTDMLHWIVSIDNHPPLYYLLLHYWMPLFGNKPYDVRLLSVLFGTATIPVIYLIGKRMSGTIVGLAAALFLALSPFNIHFAQVARMFTLLAFNASVSIYALVRLLTDPRSARPIGSQLREYLRAWRTPAPAVPIAEREFTYKPSNLAGWRAWIFRHRLPPIQTIATDLSWIAFVVFSAATLLTHNWSILFPLATNIFVLALMLYQRIKRSGSLPGFQAPSFLNWVIAQAGIFLVWSPWSGAFTRQIGRIYQEFLLPKPGWDSIIQALKSFLNDFVPGHTRYAQFFWILYTLVLCIGVVLYLKRISSFLFLAALFAIPFLAELIVSLRQPVFSAQTLIWTTIPLFLLLGAGIAQLKFRLLVIVVLGLLAANNLFSAGDYFRFSPSEDWSNVAGYVANSVEKDDLILFNATWVQIPFDYSFKKYEKQYYLEVVKHGVPVDLFDSGIPEPRMAESDLPRLDSLLSGHQRVWLVYTHNSYTDPLGLIPSTLTSGMNIIQQRDFSEVRVQLYVTP